MPDTATLQARLVEAEAAAHDLAIGRQVTSVGTGQDRVTYGPADAAKLAAYIADLRRQIDAPRRGGAIGLRFR